MKKLKGLTLIESIMYMAISSILILIVTEIFITIIDVNLENQSTNAISTDSKFIYQKLKSEITNADQIANPTQTQQVTDNLIYTKNGKTYSIKLQDGNLVISVDGQESQLNSDNVKITQLSFQKIGPLQSQTVQYSYIIQSQIVRNSIQQHVQIKSTVKTK